MTSKSRGIRPKITLARSEYEERNYITGKNHRNMSDRPELARYYPRYHKSTAYRETC